MQTYSLFVSNLDKTRVAPGFVVDAAEAQSEAPASASARRKAITQAFTYAYYYDTTRSNKYTGADAFIGSGRFAFVDLSAGPSQYGGEPFCFCMLCRRSSPCACDDGICVYVLHMYMYGDGCTCVFDRCMKAVTAAWRHMYCT